MENDSVQEQEEKEIVIARLGTLPEGYKISIGSDGDFSKEELIRHIENGNEIGKKIVEIQMSFLRSLKEGSFYEQMSSVDPPRS